MTSYIPINQKTSVDPYSAKLFDFDTVSSNAYISRSINENLMAYGNECIINGIDITALVYDQNTDLLTMTITPGKLIIDLTLVELLQPQNLSIDLTNYITNQPIYIWAGFRFLHVPYKQEFEFNVFFQEPAQLHPATEFDPSRSRVLCAALEVDLATSAVSNVPIVGNPPMISLVDTNPNVNGLVYEYRPIPSVVRSSFKHLNDELKGLCLNVSLA